MAAPKINKDAVISFMTDGYWAGGASAVLTYSTAGGSWGGYGVNGEPSDPGYALFNTTQTNAFIWAMETWDSFVAAEFNYTSGVGNIRVAFTGIADAGVWGYAYLPGFGTSNGTTNRTGDIWVDDTYVNRDFAFGRFDYAALLHEIGHTLGLDHSFREDGEPASETLPAQYENARYSIMSYTDIADYWHVSFAARSGGGIRTNFESVNPVTPMMFDILVVQDIYGRSTTTRTGATTYKFNADFAGLQTIFDSSGRDTWNLAGHDRPSIIDLRPASFSSIDLFTKDAQIEYWVDQFGESYRSFITNQVNASDTYAWEDNVAIAYQTTIENVICGSGDDSVTGNNAANKLQGRSGDDVLKGLNGNDTLIGGVGKDMLTGGAGNDKFVLNAPANAANRDVIKDFHSGADKIHLENSVFSALGAAGGLAASKFWTGANAHDANDRIIYNASTGALYYDADGNGAGAKVQIATLSGHPTLVASDFLVI